MTTQRQVESNRLNAHNHATAPRTREGKEASKRNALNHGRAGTGVVLPQDQTQAAADRATRWRAHFRPDTPYKVWLVHLAARESVRVERCFVEESALRANLALCAGFRWDLDRRVDAETLATRLAQQPALVSRKLRQSAQGCALLLERWRGLVQIVDENDDGDESLAVMAMDLLGIPTALRRGLAPLLPVSQDGDPIAALRAVARAEIAALEASRAGVLADLDGAEQGSAALGLGLGDNAAVKQLRRYEADCQRRLRWALEQLQTSHVPVEATEAPPAPVPVPVIAPAASAPTPPEPEIRPEPSPSSSPSPRPASAPASIVCKPLFLGASLTEALAPSPESGNRRTRRARRRLAMKG